MFSPFDIKKMARTNKYSSDVLVLNFVNNGMNVAMSQEDPLPKPERIPFFQRVLENPFLLLFLGIVMPTVFYVLWGIMEIATIPVAP